MNEQRVARVERAVGVVRGPRVPCPSCGGAGETYRIAGRRHGHLIECAMAKVVAELGGTEYVEPEMSAEAQAEPLDPCGRCHGLGEVSEATMPGYEREMAESRAWLAGRLSQVAERMATIEVVGDDGSDDPPPEPTGPPALRAVDG